MRSSTKTRAHSKLRLSICATRVQLYEGDRAKVMIINPGPGIIGRLNDALFHKIFPRDVAHARPRSPITNGCVSFPRDPETSNNVAALRISQPTASSNAGLGFPVLGNASTRFNSTLKIIVDGCLFNTLRISIFRCLQFRFRYFSQVFCGRFDLQLRKIEF